MIFPLINHKRKKKGDMKKKRTLRLLETMIVAVLNRQVFVLLASFPLKRRSERNVQVKTVMWHSKRGGGRWWTILILPAPDEYLDTAHFYSAVSWREWRNSRLTLGLKGEWWPHQWSQSLLSYVCRSPALNPPLFPTSSIAHKLWTSAMDLFALQFLQHFWYQLIWSVFSSILSQTWPEEWNTQKQIDGPLLVKSSDQF